MTFKLEATEYNQVGFAGDWHGNTFWALNKIKSFAELDIKRIYHVGDFGLWPGHDGAGYLRKVNRDLDKHDINIYVTLGNHDDYDKFDVLREVEGGWKQFKGYPRIFFAQRGQVWYDGNVRMAALGGAGSIDKNLRTEGKSWWAQEEVLDSDVDKLIKNVEDAGWDRVDLLITHDAATGTLQESKFFKKPYWFTPDVELYCNVQRNRLRIANDAVRPHTVIHGHWHNYRVQTLEGIGKDNEPYETQYIGLACDNMYNNTIIVTLTNDSPNKQFYLTE